VSEGPIGLCHLVSIFPLLDGATLALIGIDKLPGKPLVHGHAFLAPRVGDYPTDSESLSPCGRNLHWDLIGRTTDPAGTDLDERLDVLHGLIEDLDRLHAQFFGGFIESFVDYLLGGTFLTVEHDLIDELSDSEISEPGIQQRISLSHMPFTRHGTTSLYPLGLRTTGTVFGTAPTTTFDTAAIKGTAYDVIAHTGKVLDSTTPDQDDRVLLQIMTDSRYI